MKCLEKHRNHLALSPDHQTPSEWKAVTASIQTLVEEATFDVSNDGISFRAMDPSHVALVDFSGRAVIFRNSSA